jgi:hypothetical protein
VLKGAKYHKDLRNGTDWRTGMSTPRVVRYRRRYILRGRSPLLLHKGANRRRMDFEPTHCMSRNRFSHTYWISYRRDLMRLPSRSSLSLSLKQWNEFLIRPTTFLTSISTPVLLLERFENTSIVLRGNDLFTFLASSPLPWSHGQRHAC